MTQEEFYVRNAITPREIEEMKKTLRIGAVIRYEELEYVPEDRRLLVPRRKKARVIHKFPHLVQIENLHGRPGDRKIRTITYPELVMERRKNHV